MSCCRSCMTALANPPFSVCRSATIDTHTRARSGGDGGGCTSTTTTVAPSITLSYSFVSVRALLSSYACSPSTYVSCHHLNGKKGSGRTTAASVFRKSGGKNKTVVVVAFRLSLSHTRACGRSRVEQDRQITTTTTTTTTKRMTAPRDSTRATVTVLIDDDLSRSGSLPALLSTDDTALYPNTHPKYTRVAARYQANAAAQSIVVVADRAVGLSRAQGCVSLSAVRAPCIPVDVVVFFEPAQITSAFQLADTGTTSSRAPISASACTPASRYLDAYLTSVVQAAAEDVRGALTPALTDHHYSDRHAAMTDGHASSISGLTMSPAHPPMDITIHLLVCPNCTEASAGTNITNANLSAKDAALFAAAAHSVARRWHSVGSTPPSPGEANRGHEWCIRRQHIGFCATLASCRRATSFVLALAGKRLKALREDAARAANTSTIGGLTKTIPVAKRAESRCGLPHQTSLCVSALTPKMIRPDAPRKCEPNDFVKLYQTMLGEIVSVSDRRAMAALAAFPTMHHLLAHVDHVYSTEAERTQEEGVPSTSASRAPTAAAVYAQNFGEDRRYNVVNEAIVDALCTDYRKAEEDETTREKEISLTT